MAKINLLPWRAERRKQRQKDFLVLLGITAAAAVLVAFGAVTYFNNLIENQTARNALLQREIAALDGRIKEIEDLERQRAALLARKAVIEQLQASRSQMVHLFDELVRTTPEGVRLTAVRQTGAQLTLEGVAQSNTPVSSFMRRIEGSGWMSRPDLSIIEAKGSDRLMPYQFSLRVTMTKPKKEGEEGQAGVEAGGAQ
jgi:type IV pilus assembly protein PilN